MKFADETFEITDVIKADARYYRFVCTSKRRFCFLYVIIANIQRNRFSFFSRETSSLQFSTTMFLGT